jgi:hypothetical protein
VRIRALRSAPAPPGSPIPSAPPAKHMC